MKNSETKAPKGATHVRLTATDGKHSTVGVKAIDLTIPPAAKAKAAPSVDLANRGPVKDRAKVEKTAPEKAAAPKAPKVKAENKGELIEKLLTSSGFKLSTILDRVMDAHTGGNRGRTLRRIRKVAVSLKEGQHTSNYIDEPDFKAGK